MTRYTPAETVRRSGFSLDTLRYYERIGLLEGVDRTAGGRRVFSDDDLGWLGLLRCLRDTGMPISAMCRFAELARQGDETVADRVELLEQHSVAVEAQLELLLGQHGHLRDKITHYRALLAADGS
ncbi:MerR family transcriptional regulator [Catellatospora tritici]|uniref:MerR family transcriptional regulator n=1 Tax=Catellatospora tritici TaxID=2851566 RepID=UPI001C2DB9A0|nr:MerR family transcriptional regulator [Catellatospora tritici]MBV1849526.1 MerR family transcriptional regulator [Catellatospora tritici]MBV1854098.1 MerR family transcriptional regulator [Catellatospora tritici]